MASLFPGFIDTFTNPVYTKINGEDVVSASHVNDLQDAVRASQEVLAGAGRPIDMESNNFIADDSSFKAMIEALDGEAGIMSQNLLAHKAYVLLTDPVQHHANVIEVTPLGNLSSDKVQSGLVEHQIDIDAIMSGGLVEGTTLDNRYVKKSGAQEMQGPLTITDSLLVNGNVTLGDGVTDVVTIAGDLIISGETEITGLTNFSDNILMELGKKIAENGADNASYIMFGADKLEFYSHKDFIFRLDADDAIDGQSDAGVFEIRNGADAQVFAINETGDLSLSGGMAANNLDIGLALTIGGSIVTDSKLDLDSETFHIQLDKDNSSAGERFLITKDNDTGAILGSPNLLLNLDENSTLTTGIHLLKHGIQETGYFGLRVISDNAGGVFFGAGVNFKHQLTNTPSSVTLIPDANSFNHSNLTYVDLNEYGFFFEFDTPAVGAAKVSGTYVTVGN